MVPRNAQTLFIITQGMQTSSIGFKFKLLLAMHLVADIYICIKSNVVEDLQSFVNEVHI